MEFTRPLDINSKARDGDDDGGDHELNIVIIITNITNRSMGVWLFKWKAWSLIPSQPSDSLPWALLFVQSSHCNEDCIGYDGDGDGDGGDENDNKW